MTEDSNLSNHTPTLSASSQHLITENIFLNVGTEHHLGKHLLTALGVKLASRLVFRPRGV